MSYAKVEFVEACLDLDPTVGPKAELGSAPSQSTIEKHGSRMSAVHASKRVPSFSLNCRSRPRRCDNIIGRKRGAPSPIPLPMRR